MEEPPLKRFKPEDGSPGSLPPLPSGWTEHTAPTGHKYYYNKATKKSTYSRPAPDFAAESQVAVPAVTTERLPAYSTQVAVPVPFDYAQASRNSHVQDLQQAPQTHYNGHAQVTPFHRPAETSFRPRHEQQQHKSRHEPKDRPKRKEAIPSCGAWVLVYTLLGRRFVHNTQTKESYWKFPPDVMKSVIAFDQLKLEEKHGKAPNGSSADAGQGKSKQPQDTGVDQDEVARHRATMDQNLRREQEEDAALLEGDEEERIWVPPAQVDKGYDSSEYEEIYVTDDSDAASEADDQPEGTTGGGPMEFNEDDIAYQLAAMEGSDDNDQPFSDQEYSFDEADADEEDEEMTDADRQIIFEQLLHSHGISPFTPWSSLLSDPSSPFLSDERFTIFPSAKSRAAAHATWAKNAIAAKREADAAAAAAVKDPKENFLSFLAGKRDAGPKLFWAEFRRKYKKEAGMKVVKGLGEKEMEKLYREYVAGLKVSVGERERQLRKALGGGGGKGDVKCDVAYWVVPEGRREEILSEYNRS